jgi:2-polyprenyl-6-methoxyphenol hydroxylase-like FAD-dependent oxidoreductase
MTLESVPRYAGDDVPAVGEHAVVVGAGIAGLLATRVLTDAFDRVTLLERDPLPDDVGARRGTQQANHVHILLEAGRVTLEDLVPGYGDEITDDGGLVVDAGTEVQYYQDGAFFASGRQRHPMLCASRPLFESTLRRRVRAYDGVSIRAACHVSDYRVDPAGDVTGVAVRTPDGPDEIQADLVVDATGRTSQTPDRLDRAGFEAPPVDEVHVDLAYSTLVLERPPSVRRGYLVGPSPACPRGGTVLPVEGNRWMVTLFGLHGDHPPTDLDGFRAFAASLPTSEVSDVLDRHPVRSGEIHHYPFPANRWVHYERLEDVPAGLLPIGDAVASFNPIYGQGMSVAALEALALHHALRTGGLDSLADRYFDRTASVIDTVWRMAVGADFEFPGTTGPKPRGTDLLNRYRSRLVRAAHSDDRVSDAFARVFLLEREPTSLLHPSIFLRVLRSTLGLT